MAFWRDLLIPSVSSNDSHLVDLTFFIDSLFGVYLVDMVFLEYPGIAARSFGNCLSFFLILPFLFCLFHARQPVQLESVAY